MGRGAAPCAGCCVRDVGTAWSRCGERPRLRRRVAPGGGHRLCCPRCGETFRAPGGGRPAAGDVPAPTGPRPDPPPVGSLSLFWRGWALRAIECAYRAGVLAGSADCSPGRIRAGRPGLAPRRDSTTWGACSRRWAGSTSSPRPATPTATSGPSWRARRPAAVLGGRRRGASPGGEAAGADPAYVPALLRGRRLGPLVAGPDPGPAAPTGADPGRAPRDPRTRLRTWPGATRPGRHGRPGS